MCRGQRLWPQILAGPAQSSAENYLQGGKGFPARIGSAPSCVVAVHVPDRRCFVAGTSHVRGPDLSSLASAALRQGRPIKLVRILSLPEWLLLTRSRTTKVGKLQVAGHSTTSALPGSEVFSVWILHGLV